MNKTQAKQKAAEGKTGAADSAAAPAPAAKADKKDKPKGIALLALPSPPLCRAVLSFVSVCALPLCLGVCA